MCINCVQAVCSAKKPFSVLSLYCVYLFLCAYMLLGFYFARMRCYADFGHVWLDIGYYITEIKGKIYITLPENTQHTCVDNIAHLCAVWKIWHTSVL